MPVTEAGDAVEDTVADEAVTGVEGRELGGREQSLHAVRDVPVDGDVADGRLDRLLQGLDQLGWGVEAVSDTVVSPVPPIPLTGHYLGLQPLGRTQELSTAPAHLGHGLQQPLAHPRAHAEAEAPAGEPGHGKPWLGWGWGLANPVVSPLAGMGRGVTARVLPWLHAGLGHPRKSGANGLRDVMGEGHPWGRCK